MMYLLRNIVKLMSNASSEATSLICIRIVIYLQPAMG